MDHDTVLLSAQQGSADACRQIFEAHKRRIFSLAFQYTKNLEDAEDILQDTFIKAFNALDSFRIEDKTNFSAWLYRIGINCSIDFLRRNKMTRNRSIEPDQIDTAVAAADRSNPEHKGHIDEIRARLDQILERMPKRQRMIFILRHYQQLSIREISEFLSCSEGSVKKQLFRAFHTIKDEFQNLFPETGYEMQKI